MSYYRLSLPSKLEEISRLRHCLGAVARIEGYSDAFIAEFELSVHEAFVNAVRHGNCDNSELPVTMTLETGAVAGDRFVEVRIRDCGEGFKPERTIDAICSARRGVTPGGRGLVLVHHYVKSFRIESEEGGCVVVLRYIPY
ncbi:hypothetical protein BIU88_06160 [Chlorobaculum limnaeum]|uniref:Histidine kinase/HSP90-like ATPase domain-containing protein n=1 Tax=Chlorobaculum limnaeum TaxID=274537 RepID=A0A1D8CXW8_CHLLM|nr:ATP-binding protein [Chlorobaculum limnaeum]AOS83770.1 hypothetical protein BIU88_06160 [Chlorobaculum limnaeum]